ncbi:MAG: response regulator [Thermodesulfobacteriota bacterium]
MDEDKPIRVLLVESDQSEAGLLRDLLQAEDEAIVLQWADRLAAALARMAAEPFDIVVTDLKLPDSNGIETFVKIRSRFPYQPVVVLAGADNQGMAMDAVRKGAQDYLIKGRAKGHSIIRLLKYSIERQRLLNECQRRIQEIRTLEGLIPVCAWCRKVHTHKGYWERVERYVEEQTGASFSHGICPECLEKTHPELFGLLEQSHPELVASQPAEEPAGRPIRLLLIEDNAADAGLVQEFAAEITGLPLAIRHVTRLATAIELLQRERFDLVLCDLGLPDSQGIETFISLNTVIPQVPIIVLTGVDDKGFAATAVRSGAQDYIVKGELDSALLRKSIRYAIERHKMLEELRCNLREVRKLHQERDSILSMFAHDIKNAIIPATLLLSRIGTGKAAPPANIVLPIVEALRSAEGMLAEFIELSRLQSRDYEPAMGVLDIEALVLGQVEVARAKASEKEIGIRLDLSPAPLPVLAADAAMLQRVLANLLDNAVKYTPQKGTVTVTVRQSETDLLVQVQDTGIGIADLHIPSIFEAFYRVPGIEKGSGLGLAIAGKIVKSHGGEIWVESTPGHGSTFSFTLPLPQPKAESACPVPATARSRPPAREVQAAAGGETPRPSAAMD